MHAVKREPSCLAVRADRVTFFKGSATSSRAGLRALAGRRDMELLIRDLGVGSNDGWLTDTGA